MTTASTPKIPHNSQSKKACAFPSRQIIFGLVGLAFLTGVTGCQTPGTAGSVEAARPPSDAGKQPDVLMIREGDTLKISFPGSPNLDTTQQVRRDGRITLPMGGEIAVTNMTPVELEQTLVQRYAPQLVSKEVTVTVVASTFAIYVSGSVLHPGKIESDHPLTALE